MRRHNPLPVHIRRLPRRRDVHRERVGHDHPELLAAQPPAIEEPRRRHERSEGRRAQMVPPHPLVSARAEGGGHKGQGALVVVDCERDLRRAALALPFWIHVRAQVDGPAEVHGLAAAALPFVCGQVAAEVAAVEHARDGELRDDRDDGAEGHLVCAAGGKDRVGFGGGEAVANALCCRGRAVCLLGDCTGDGVATLELSA